MLGFEKARSKNYKFLWTNQGKIYLRKDTNSSVKLIANMKDLDSLKRLVGYQTDK